MSDAAPTAAPPTAHTAAPVAAPVAAAPEWGDPFPLGLASFGISALVLATVMSGIVDAAALPAGGRPGPLPAG